MSLIKINRFSAYFVAVGVGAMLSQSLYASLPDIGSAKAVLKRDNTQKSINNGKSTVSQLHAFAQRFNQSSTKQRITSGALNQALKSDYQVDRQTGVLNLKYKIGSIFANFGLGPNYTPTLVYQQTLRDKDTGFGKGWFLNTTRIIQVGDRHLIVFSDGTSQYLTKLGEGGKLQYHKENDIKLQWLTSSQHNLLRIRYKSGITETLDKEGRLKSIKNEAHKGLRFYYRDDGRIESIADDDGNEIYFSYSTNEITVNSGRFINNKDSKVVLSLSNDRLENITFNGASENALLSTAITYNTLGLPEELKNHLKTDHFTYQALSMPDGSSVYAVKEQEISALNAKTSLTSYSYDGSNYTGYPLAAGMHYQANKDNAYAQSADFTYTTSQTHAGLKIENTYNKWHLLVSQKKINLSNNQLLRETSYRYNLNDATNYAELAKNYGLPVEIKKTYYNDIHANQRVGTHFNTQDKRIETTMKSYDDNGNLLEVIESDGTKKHYRYSPANRYGFVRDLEEERYFPRNTSTPNDIEYYITQYGYEDYGQDGYDHVKLLTSVKKGAKRRDKATQYYLESVNTYYSNPDEENLYTRLKTTETKDLVGDPDLQAVKTSYQYTLNRKVGELNYVTQKHLNKMQNKADQSATEAAAVTNTIDMRNGKLLRITKGDQVQKIFEYDPYNRVRKEVIHPKSQYEKEIGYSYISNNHELSTTVIKPTDERVKTRFNGFYQKVAQHIQNREGADSYKLINIKYNRKGLPHEWTEYDNLTADNAADVVNDQETFYDVLGREVKTLLNDKLEKYTFYNDVDNLEVSYFKEKGSSVIERVDKKAYRNAQLVSEGTYKLDSDINHLTPLSKTSYEYDGFNRLSKTRLSNGSTQENHYDIAGNLIKEITSSPDKLEQSGTYKKYNLLGQVIETGRLSGEQLEVENPYGTRQYNALGQLVSEQDLKVSQNRKAYTYNNFGTLVAKVDLFGNQIKYDIDPTLQLPILAYSTIGGSKDTEGEKQFEYNHFGKLKKLTANGYSILYKHGINDLMDTLVVLKGDQVIQDEHYKYTKSGRLSQSNKEYYNNEQLLLKKDDIYHYGDFGRIKEREINLTREGESKSFGLIYAYDGLGRQTGLLLNDFIDANYHYNDTGFLDKIAYSQSKGEAQDLYTVQYGHSRSNKTGFYTGNIASREIKTPYYAGERSYSYDYLNRLKTLECNSTQGRVCYAENTSASGVRHDAKSSYFYDENNQISSVEFSNIDGSQLATTSYDYDRNYASRLQSINHSVGGARGMMYYDSGSLENTCLASNCTGQYRYTLYEYNKFSKLDSIQTIAGGAIANSTKYSYLPNDQLVNVLYQNDRGRLNTKLFYSDNKLSTIYTKDSDHSENIHLKGYIYANGIAVASVNKDLQLSYLLHDEKGSVVAEYQEDSEIQNKLNWMKASEYTDYGVAYHPMLDRQSRIKRSSPVTSNISPLGFLGQYTDNNTNLQYLGNGYRAYDAKVGRFISPDGLSPFGKGGLNAYAYGENNPVLYSDPDGHEIIISMLIASIVSGAVIGGTVGAITAGINSNWDVEKVLLGAFKGSLQGAVTGAFIGVGAGVAAPILANSVNFGIDLAFGVPVEEAFVKSAIGMVSGGLLGGTGAFRDTAPYLIKETVKNIAVVSGVNSLKAAAGVGSRTIAAYMYKGINTLNMQDNSASLDPLMWG